MLNKLLNYIKEKELILKGQRLLLAISGGIDSMVMLDLFLKSDFKISIAHCNFKLRGEESDADELFVKHTAINLQIAFHNICFETKEYASENKISIQMAARELRYKWFEDLCKEYKYDYIVTAHHKNDQVETILLNLTRGTGIKGLSGIQPKSENIIRPLLFASKKEIEHYASTNKIKFRKDKSNSSTKYKRNYIRHKIIPEFEKLNPDFINSINDFSGIIGDVNYVFQKYIKSELEKIVKSEGEKVYVNIKSLQKLDYQHIYLYELLSKYNFSYDNIKKVVGSLNEQSGLRFESSSHILIKDRENLIITPQFTQTKAFYKVERNNKLINTPIELHITTMNVSEFKLVKSLNVAQLDFDKLKFPLILRRWQKGDKFFPIGMNKPKKLSDFFIDIKLSLDKKNEIWLLCSEDQIVWVVGYRIDDRYKITKNTKKVYMLKL